MNQTVCSNCGAPLASDRPGSLCPACGAPELSAASPKIQTLLDTAFALLRESRFDEAKTAFEAVLQKDFVNPVAYWGRLCARYYITYTEVFEGVFAPHCPTRSGANLSADTDYRKAMKYADEDWRVFLLEQAEYIKSVCSHTNHAANEFTMGTVDPEDELITAAKPIPDKKEKVKTVREKKERPQNERKIDKKKILVFSTVLILLLAVGIGYWSVLFSTIVFSWKDDGTYSVSGIGICTVREIVIPRKYDGKTVTSIGAWAYFCSSLTSITIPDGVTSIGSAAFYGCSSLTSITIPTGVTSIGDSAFKYCSSLTSITYGGTKAQWEAISLGSDWNSDTGNYTVTCTDGTLSK